MTDLKPYFDRAKADSDEVTRLQNELNTQFNSGTDEGVQAAIDLQPTLEAAIVKATESNKLYLTMRNADQNTSSAASLFVSANAEEEHEDEKKMTLAAFNALAPKQRLAFSKAGGSIEG
jgi:hypothetical protein